MNIKNLPITIVLLVVALLVVGCGPGSEQPAPSPTATDIPEPSPTATDVPAPSPTTIDLSLLSKDLAGHWGILGVLDVYFGEADEKGIGYGFWGGVEQSYYFSYRIVSVDGPILTLEMVEKGGNWPWPAEIKIAGDGRSIIYSDIHSIKLQYIDSKTEP